jgi:RecB family endonuclease NucS
MALSILSVPGQALAVEKATTKISKPAISKYQRYIYRYQNGVMQRKNVDGQFVLQPITQLCNQLQVRTLQI